MEGSNFERYYEVWHRSDVGLKFISRYNKDDFDIAKQEVLSRGKTHFVLEDIKLITRTIKFSLP